MIRAFYSDNQQFILKATFLVIAIALCFGNLTLAQTDSTKALTKKIKPDSVKQLDLVDLAKKILKINLAKGYDTTKKIPPGKLLLSIAPAIGYTLEESLLFNAAFNTSFYTSDPDNTYLSVISNSFEYSIRNQFQAPIVSNIWLPKNKWDLQGDWRYYKYPSTTYGLGGNPDFSVVDHTDYSYIKFSEEVLRYFGKVYAGFGYDMDYHFNISDPNPVTDFQQYNNYATHTLSSGFVLHFMYDTRTNLNNPKKAFFLSLYYRNNNRALGSDENWQQVLVEARKYFKLSPHKVLAFWSYNSVTFDGKAPYFDLPANGWDTYSNTGRGYIQGRFKGPAFIYGETELRFRILNNGFLGGVIFANASSVEGWPTPTFSQIYPAGGAGLRFKFNKYSDVNVAIDYAIGLYGSGGVFFNLGEVF